MRVLALSIVALGILSIPAQAQTYDPHFPVCMKLITWGGGEWIDCSFTSLPQCKASASGRAGTCDPNPYFAAVSVQPQQTHRRHHRAD